MTVRATVNLNLGIAGPFLCTGTAPTSWGLDSSFDRDYLGRPYIDRTHLKGKLREALRELDIKSDVINGLLGKGEADGNGSLYFSDLRLKDEVIEENLMKGPAPDSLTRINKNVRGAMFVQENAFPGAKDKVYTWAGSICFVAGNKEDADKLSQSLIEGLKWIGAFGAEKGVGFGRLKSVALDPVKGLKTADIEINPQRPETISDQLTVIIETKDPLLFADVRIIDNYLESMEYITGNVLKAALAQAVTIAVGADSPFIMGNGVVFEKLPLLTKYFDQIRFLHSFPSTTEKRPNIIPYSIVKAGDHHYDVALKPGPNEVSDNVIDSPPWLFDGKAPIFQTDWKGNDYPDDFGWATPQRFAKTRTAIDETTRRADDGRMFTYQYVCPITTVSEKNEQGKLVDKTVPVRWIGGVSLAGVPEGDRPGLQGELECAFRLLSYIGKHKSLVKVQTKPSEPEPCRPVKGTILDSMAIVTFQSDTFMVDPGDLVGNQTGARLHELYAQFWSQDSNSGFELVRFFAAQKLRGGYLANSRRTGPKKDYYPFYLTEAGSVFVLRVTDLEKAQNSIKTWQDNGLTVPDWVQGRYGDGSSDMWRVCPYLHENGFGEVAVNLLWSEPEKTEGGETP